MMPLGGKCLGHGYGLSTVGRQTYSGQKESSGPTKVGSGGDPNELVAEWAREGGDEEVRLSGMVDTSVEEEEAMEEARDGAMELDGEAVNVGNRVI